MGMGATATLHAIITSSGSRRTPGAPVNACLKTGTRLGAKPRGLSGSMTRGRHGAFPKGKAQILHDWRLTLPMRH